MEKLFLRISYILLLTLSSCLSALNQNKAPKGIFLINVEEVKAGKDPGRFIKTSREIFFNKMIHQKHQKMLTKNWMIIHKDDQYLYYGFVYRKGKNECFTDTVFTVNREELREFPELEKREFWWINNMLMNYAYEEEDFGKNWKMLEVKDHICLSGSIISMRSFRKFKTWKTGDMKKQTKEMTVDIEVDAKTLTLLSRKGNLN